METEIYRIKKGELFSENINIPFDFGIIKSISGKFYIDLYVNEKFNLEIFTNRENDNYMGYYYNANCITEENNKLDLYQLSITNVNPNISKLRLNCLDKIKHTKIKHYQEESDIKQVDYLYYLLIEGLKIEFTNFTEKKIYRNGIVVNDLNNIIRDHSSIILQTKLNSYNLTFTKSKLNESDIVIEFINNEFPNLLTYAEYIDFKRDLINILSLINGAEVNIRKECTGSYYTINEVDAEIVYHYSFETIKNIRYNSYVPINNPFHRSANILNKILMDCFENYREWNNKINLNSIIFYLTNSEQTKSIEEKVFVQMIAFERLTTLYSNNIVGEKIVYSPENIDYQQVKEELLEVVERRKEIFGESYHTIKSKIGNLNQIKKLSTTQKMFRIINDVEIEINNDIENLINSCRHNTIHVGEIGEGNEAELNFYLLDELLREIILRLIKYNGPRDNYKICLK